MRTILAAVIAAAAGSVTAQAESFDIATFVAPAGWARAESERYVMFQNRRAALGRTEFCQIYLFRSRAAANANPAEEFGLEFQARTSRIIYVPRLPTAAPATRTPDGWTVLMAYSDLVTQGTQESGLSPGTPARVVLMSYFGFGKVMSALVLVSPNSYRAEVEGFLGSLRMQHGSTGQGVPGQGSATTGSAAAGSAGTLANYSYAVPDTWTRQEARDRIVLLSPAYQTGERCQVTILPMRPAGRPVADDAIAIYREIFKIDPLTPYAYVQPKLARGFSPQGWEYFVIRKSIGGTDGDMGTTLMVARVGAQMATIVGTGKRPLVSSCFGEMVYDAWPKFFYSLQFRNQQPTGQEQGAIRQMLAGTWVSATGSVGLRYTFAANGRYEDAGATRRGTRISPTEVLVTTQAYFGNGSYAFDGNRIVFTDDDGTRSANYFRLQQESEDGGRTWMNGMCLLDPASTGEVCYRKQ